MFCGSCSYVARSDAVAHGLTLREGVDLDALLQVEGVAVEAIVVRGQLADVPVPDLQGIDRGYRD